MESVRVIHKLLKPGQSHFGEPFSDFKEYSHGPGIMLALPNVLLALLFFVFVGQVISESRKECIEEENKKLESLRRSHRAEMLSLLRCPFLGVALEQVFGI